MQSRKAKDGRHLWRAHLCQHIADVGNNLKELRGIAVFVHGAKQSLVDDVSDADLKSYIASTFFVINSNGPQTI